MTLLQASPNDERPYDCPYCDGQLLPLSDHPDLACNLCGRRFDSEMLYAYKDGEEAFVEGYQGFTAMLKRRIEKRDDYLERQTNERYGYAYTKLRSACRFELPEIYRLAAIEMLAAITDYFSARGMTSRYEAGYWRRLLVEVDDDRALTELEAQLAKPIRGPLDPFKHLFARMERRRRLRRLRQMDRQIVELEHVISFVDVPRARRRSQHLERLVSRAR